MAAAIELLDLLEEFEEEIVPRRFPDYSNPVEKWNDREFIKRFRMKKESFLALVNEVSDHVSRKTSRSKPMPPVATVAAAVYYLATAAFQSVIWDVFGISQRSVCVLP